MSMHGGGAADHLSPLRNLSLTDTKCTNDSCLAFYAAHNKSQVDVSYARQYEYGHWVTWYYLILISAFFVVNCLYLWHDRKFKPSSSNTLSPFQRSYAKVVALSRSLFYRRLRGRVFNSMGYLPSVGMILFLLLGVVFFTILTFAVRPYYRGRRGYGSPPTAVRTGLMATALTPLIVALSGKANIVTLLTGIGHEKLNVIHRWAAWACLVLSIVHTVPFLVAPYRDGGSAALHKQFYKKNSYEYTGTPPLAILVGIVAFSVPWIRHRFYETFYHLHILMGIIYVGLMFWHCNDQRDSWAYMWATIALWLASIVTRAFWFNRTSNIRTQWFDGARTSLQALPGGMSRLTVSIPQDFHWKAGQHCFLRFPSISLLDSHPFTIAGNAKTREDGAGKDQEAARRQQNSIIFLVRSRTGFTRKLSKFIRKISADSAACWLDGPYGGLRRKIENVYDSVILVAGGTGITGVLPWLQHLAINMQAGTCRTSNVKLIWVVREAEHLRWVSKELVEIFRLKTHGKLSVEFYVSQKNEITEPASPKEETKIEDIEIIKTEAEEEPSESVIALGPCNYGRPSLGDKIRDIEMAGRTMVFGCGPESMKLDLSNACAHAQKRVLKGEIVEVALHTDTFGW